MKIRAESLGNFKTFHLMIKDRHWESENRLVIEISGEDEENRTHPMLKEKLENRLTF